MMHRTIPSRPGWDWDGQRFTREDGDFRLEVRSGHAARWTLYRGSRSVAAGHCYTAREGMDKAERHLEIEKEQQR